MTDGWVETTLASAALFTAGKNAPRADRVENGPYRMMGANGHIGFVRRAIHEGPLITVGRVGAYGAVHDIDKGEKCWISDNALIARPRQGVEHAFLKYLLQSVDYDSIKTGTTQPLLTQRALATVPVLLPPLPVQRRIVDLMEHLDTHITNLEAEWMSCSGALRLRRDVLLSLDETVPAVEVFSILMGRQRSPSRATGPNMTPYLRAANVKDGYLDLEDVKSMDFDALEQSTYGLKVADVVVSEGSGSHEAVGACSVIDRLPSQPMCFQNTLLRYRALDGRSLPGFVHHWCRWAFESGAFKAVATGTNILHIGSRRAAHMRVPVMSLEQQAAVAFELDGWQQTADRLLREAELLRAAREKVMAVLLAADVAIPESYDDLRAVAS